MRSWRKNTGPARLEPDEDGEHAHEGERHDAHEPADHEVEGALGGHVEAPELDVPHVEERDALDVVDEGPRAHDLEQARHDVHLYAGVGAGPRDLEEVVVAGAGEGDDHAIHPLLVDDAWAGRPACPRTGIRGPSDARLRRGSPSSRKPDQAGVVVAVLGDLAGDGVAHLAGADDEHTLRERAP